MSFRAPAINPSVKRYTILAAKYILDFALFLRVSLNSPKPYVLLNRRMAMVPMGSSMATTVEPTLSSK